MKLMSYIRAKHNLIFKLFIVVFCSFLFALMLPYKEIKGHRVDVFTAVWVYEDLIAEQNLLIQKSVDELKQERKQLQKESALFFEINTSEKSVSLTIRPLNTEFIKIPPPTQTRSRPLSRFNQFSI